MREIKTIEVDKWVPSERQGMVKHAGMISPQEAFDALKKHLEDVGLLPDEYFNSNDWMWRSEKELPDYIRASCDVNWGGNEGIYLDISLLYREDNEIKRFNFATGKTLGRSGDDFLHMSRIAAECSMMLNGRGSLVKVSEHNYDNINAEVKEKPSLSSQIETAKEKNVAEDAVDKDKKELVTFLKSLLDAKVFSNLCTSDEKYAESLTKKFIDKFSDGRTDDNLAER